MSSSDSVLCKVSVCLFVLLHCRKEIALILSQSSNDNDDSNNKNKEQRLKKNKIDGNDNNNLDRS